MYVSYGNELIVDMSNYWKINLMKQEISYAMSQYDEHSIDKYYDNLDQHTYPSFAASAQEMQVAIYIKMLDWLDLAQYVQFDAITKISKMKFIKLFSINY